MTRRTADESRRHVLRAAGTLFYEHGIRAVGMDQIVAAAGVGNATVYRQFATKDHLAAAYVQDRADAWFERMRAVTDATDGPRAAMIAVVAIAADDSARSSFRGCAMLNAHTEFPAPEHPAHVVAVDHERRVHDWFLRLATEAEARDPEALADELLLVLNGTLATAAVLGHDGPARHGLDLARRLVETACPPGA